MFRPAPQESETEPPESDLDLDGARTPPPRPPDQDPPFVRPFAPKPSTAPAFISGGVGVLVGAAIALGATYLFASGDSDLQAVKGQVAALNSADANEASARKALDGRLAALEAKSSQPAGSPDVAALDSPALRARGLGRKRQCDRDDRRGGESGAGQRRQGRRHGGLARRDGRLQTDGWS